MSAGGLCFDAPVVAGGYRWWYLDALSDDQRYGLTIIALVGSVFSPYYARARQRGSAPAESFCALNAVLYGPRSKHWAMTERGAGDLLRAQHRLLIGPSSVRWESGALVVDVDEITVPWPGRLRGQVRLHPQCTQDECFALDAQGMHHWWPIAPIARVEVRMAQPDLSWQGHGYLDSNWGEVPLEQSFTSWDWSRAHMPDGSAVLLYEPRETNAARRLLARRFYPDGSSYNLSMMPEAGLPATRIWRIARCTRADHGSRPAVTRTLEDTPFYARSLLSTRLLGEPALAVHESLSLERFSRSWVRGLLPFRMPRRARPHR
jgi:carotenoid 1,2-hydratase